MADETVDSATTTDSGTGTQAAAAVETVVPDKATTETATKTADAAVETKVEGAKGDEASKTDVKPTIPEAYEFKAPEGTTLDEGAIAIVTPVLKKLGVTQEGAQELAETFAQIQAAQLTAQAETWAAALKTDPEIGGKNYDANVSLARQEFAKWATPELKQFLDTTGLGNHPEILRPFLKIAKASQQDSHVSAGSGTPESDPAKVLFPGMN